MSGHSRRERQEPGGAAGAGAGGMAAGGDYGAYGPRRDTVGPRVAGRLEREAGKLWDLFYKRNGRAFFKDRHYLGAEFPELRPGLGPRRVLEVGCGAGNLCFPLAAANPELELLCCDFSPRAVELVERHEREEARTGRVRAFVFDLTSTAGAPTVGGGGGAGGGAPAGPPPLTRHVGPGAIDLVTAVFVFSAISPEKMPAALANLRGALRPGGKVLFRDYAAGDLAEERLRDKARPQKISDNFYVRGDGTRAYYFSEAVLEALFREAGFVPDGNTVVHEREIENRKAGVVMSRRWIQASFTLREGAPPAPENEELTAVAVGQGASGRVEAKSGVQLRREGAGSAGPGPGRPGAAGSPERHAIDTRGWLSGAAGRLTQDRGSSAAAAALPETLDSAALEKEGIAGGGGEAEGDLEARVEAEFFAAVGQREEVAVADMEQWLIEEKREPRGANVRLETDVRKLALED